jgi:hypothetical protein
MTLTSASMNALECAVLDLDNLADARTLTQWLSGDADMKAVLR